MPVLAEEERSMTEDQLAAIEARAEAHDPNDYPVPIMAYDIPALVAEVRRLRRQVDALALLVPEVFDEAYWCCEYDSHGCKSTYQDSYWKESESLKNLTAILTPTNNANGAESEGA
jgi:hypothetical protein